MSPDASWHETYLSPITPRVPRSKPTRTPPMMPGPTASWHETGTDLGHVVTWPVVAKPGHMRRYI